MGHRGMRAFINYDKETTQPTINKSLLLRVAAYAQPYRRRIASLLLLLAASSLLALVSPMLFRDLIDDAIPQGDTGRLNLLALALLAVPVASGLVQVAQSNQSSVVGNGIICDLRRALYFHMQRMGMAFFTHTKTGEMMSRLNNDVDGAQRAVTGTLVTLTSNVISLLTTLVVMISLEWRLTLAGVMILPLLIIPSRRVGSVLRIITRQAMEARARLSTQMNETLNVSGALLVKVFGRGKDENARFGQAAEAVRDIQVRSNLVGRWFRLGLSLVGAVGTALVYWLGGHLVLRGTFTVGTIVAFSAYLTRLYGPLIALTNARIEFATSMVSFERVFEVLDLPVEIDELPDAKVLPTCDGHVQFEGVTFNYATGENITGLENIVRYGRGGSGLDVTKSGARANRTRGNGTGRQSMRRNTLEDISFDMLPGELTALVGPSGAGKTTVTYLLPRLYDPDAGVIRLDGHDLRDLALDTLPAHIGMVTQETYLFHDTIRANLLYARPDAADDEIIAACRAANIHEFIESLPNGYNTVVGERGHRLSGGEKQRVAIARVLLNDPRVLILDEATSHLDSENEAQIQRALEGLMVGRTSLVIAHRLSTILAADQILVVDDGRLVDRGTHAELLERGGLYGDLYERQFRDSLAEAA